MLKPFQVLLALTVSYSSVKFISLPSSDKCMVLNFKKLNNSDTVKEVSHCCLKNVNSR